MSRRAGPDPDAEFREFVAARWGALVRYAYLFTADRGHAEDLVQHALERTWRRWRQVRIESPEAYVRAAVAHGAAARGRRRRVVEAFWADVGAAAEARAVVPDVGATPPERAPLWLALQGLPPRMRAVVVLRVWEDFSEAQTARVLGVTPGTVKSHLSRALDRLRATEGVQALRSGTDDPCSAGTDRIGAP